MSADISCTSGMKPIHNYIYATEIPFIICVSSSLLQNMNSDIYVECKHLQQVSRPRLKALECVFVSLGITAFKWAWNKRFKRE